MPETVPGYWTNETTGRLRPAILAYLGGGELDAHQVAAIRAYFRQWMEAPEWRGPLVDVLRTQAAEICTRQDIERWLDRAWDSGIDPL